MKSSQPHRDESPTPPNKSTVVLLLKEIGDTTWRMFVPILGGTILGVVCDKQFGTYPIAVIAGIVIGVTITGLLIWKQLKRIR